MYPLKFTPIVKDKIWGGDRLQQKFGKHPGNLPNIGESWELSGVPGDFSVVSNGYLAGKTLPEIIAAFKEQLVGKRVYNKSGNDFPLLFKLIDANDDLSIQVHPNDEVAAKRHNSFGKTEMWYVVKASDDAILYSGFSQQIDSEEYVKRVNDNTIMDVLKKYNVKQGDVFFLPAGRVHAIGAGCFIAEIQQTSNITYRIYDYDRRDAQGNGRELHTELAKDAIDYTLYPDYRTSYTPKRNESVSLASCKYFTTNLLELDNELNRDFTSLDSFVVYICIEGACELLDDKGNKISLKQGQTVLVPADTQKVTLSPVGNGVKLLETYIG